MSASRTLSIYSDAWWYLPLYFFNFYLFIYFTNASCECLHRMGTAQGNLMITASLFAGVEGRICSMLKFLGQGLNPSHGNNNAEALTSRPPGNSWGYFREITLSAITLMPPRKSANEIFVNRTQYYSHFWVAL